MPGLLIVRHAQSTWNAEGRWQGQADPPLSDLGEQQAIVAASRLAAEAAFDGVAASDLVRARLTAELMAQELGLDDPVHFEAGLREYDVGEWSGLTRDEIEAAWPGAIRRFSLRELDAPPGGESRSEFDGRVTEAGRKVAAWAATTGKSRILVVAHGGVLRSLATTAGRPDVRLGHLAGYRGRYAAGGLFPEELVDLLAETDDFEDLPQPSL